MIEPVGIKPGVVTERRAASTDPVAAVASAGKAKPAAVAETGARAVAAQMAASAPIDVERVQLIKRAIAEGRFPIAPAEIADRLIAAQYDWADKK